MKVSTEKKKLPKWVKYAIIAGVAIVVIVVSLVIKGMIKPKGSIYDDIDTFMAQETCNFRYILNVRSEEHNEESKNKELEDYMNEVSNSEEGVSGTSENKLDEYESGKTEDDPNRSQTGNLYGDRINAEWSTADGSKVVNWDYPNYELVITGRTESVEPLKCSFKMQLSTDYASNEFCNIVFDDDKCYVDIKTLRNWLVNSGDSNLVQLADKIPDNAVYVEISGDDLRFVTPYAELGEEEFSGALGIRNLYQRCIVIEKILTQGMRDGLGNTGLSAEKSKCRISLSEESATKLLSTIKGMFTGASGVYDTYVNSLKKSNLVTEDEVTQLGNERDNFITAMSNNWAKLGTLTPEAIKAIDLNLIGKSSRYTASTGGGVLELNLGTSFTLNNTDYVITLYGCKQDLSIPASVSVDFETATSVPLSTISGDYDLGYVKDYLMYYFKLRAADNSKQLNVSFDSLQQGVLNDFIELVNQTNSKLGGGITKQNIFTIESYIAKYSSMTEEEAGANDVSKTNYSLVKNFIGVLQTIENIQKEEETTEVESPTYKNIEKLAGNCLISGRIDEGESNSSVLKIELKAQNLSDKTINYDLTKWYVLDSFGNKYPCNYAPQLDEVGSVKAPYSTKVEIAGVSRDEILGALANDKADKLSGLEGDKFTAELKKLNISDLLKVPSTGITLYVVISDIKAPLTLYTDSEELGIIVE